MGSSCLESLSHCITSKSKTKNSPKKEKNNFDDNGICSNLPCPQCASHASGLIKTQFEECKNKSDIIKFVHFMHNEVNKRLKKNLFV